MRIVIIYILIVTSTLINAQEIIIQPPLFTPFECTEFYKLYTGMVINFSEEDFETKLLLEVDYTSPSGNTQRLADGILSGNPSVVFAAGMTTNVNNATYESIYTNRNITFYDKDIENLLSRTKCLPPGQYDVCLTLLEATASDGSQEFLTQTCYTREKQMLSNLLLVSPFEESEVVIDMPLFTWTPVTPFNSGAIYRIQMVEVLANQTPFEVFRSNPIFFEQTGLMSNIFQYPVSARTMLPCTRYAWRVTYELRGGFVSTAFQKSPDFLQESEIWVFSRPCDEEEEEEEDVLTSTDKYYYKPSLSKTSTIHQHVGKDFWFEIDNPYQARKGLNLQIENEEGEKTSMLCCYDTEDADDDYNQINGDTNVTSGKNYLYIDLDKLGLQSGQFYKLSFTDFKNPLFINFKYKEDEE